MEDWESRPSENGWILLQGTSANNLWISISCSLIVRQQYWEVLTCYRHLGLATTGAETRTGPDAQWNMLKAARLEEWAMWTVPSAMSF